MSNWDLIMPGGGLTAIGLVGLITSYSGIAHTFVDGMHALTGLLFMFGLIIMSAGILEGGISTSNRTKATALTIISISLGFGTFATTMTENSTLPLFAGLLIMIAIPAIVISYFAMKMPTYAKPVGVIFILAFGTGIGLYMAFGFVGPDQYLVTTEIEVEEVVEEAIPEGPLFIISMLAGSAEQGAPDYEPDEAVISQGYIIEWINNDEMAHTATSSLDFGETFDTGLLNGGESYKLDTNKLDLGTYEYMCIVHPWMVSTIIIEESA
ncbi:copper-binding protein, partial [Candidatus Nitrosopelagicus sp.]|nr:copper-binding protein [Candidatus Nitrosopelagicus sp.]